MTKHTAHLLSSPALLSLAALLALVPVEVAAQGYDLPPAPTPTPSPVYGPQDGTQPRSTPIPTPTARPTQSPAQRDTPTPQPTATAAPTQGPVVQPLPSARTTRQPVQERRPPPTQAPTGQTPGQAPPTAPTPSASASGLPTLPSPTTSPVATGVSAEPEDASGLPWLWIVLVGLLAALGGAFLWWRRREDDGPVAVPQIERPEPVVKKTTVTVPLPETAQPAPVRVAPMPTAAPAPVAAQAGAVSFSHGPLHVAFETRNLTITMMAASLAYRLTLSNRGREALADIVVGGTMEAASEQVAIERQLEPPLGELPVSHRLDALAAGDVHELTGEIRIPLAQLRVIRRGEALLFVPIARLRVTGAAESGDALIARRSVLLGLTGQGPQLAPIRVDAGPRVYSEIGQQLVEPRAA